MPAKRKKATVKSFEKFEKEFVGFKNLPEWAKEKVDGQPEDYVDRRRSAVRVINSDGGCCLFMNAFTLFCATDDGAFHVVVSRNSGCHVFPVGKNSYVEEREDPEIIAKWLKGEGTAS